MYVCRIAVLFLYADITGAFSANRFVLNLVLGKVPKIIAGNSDWVSFRLLQGCQGPTLHSVPTNERNRDSTVSVVTRIRAG
jgi:hypothetical protein